MTTFKCREGCCNLLIKKYINLNTNMRHKYNKKKTGIFLYDKKQRKVLLVQSKGSLFGLPKGSLEENENELDGAIREVYEETGIIIKREDLEKCNYIVLYNRCKFYFMEMKECDVKIQDMNDTNDVNGITWIKIRCLIDLIKRKKILLNYYTRICFRDFLNINIRK